VDGLIEDSHGAVIVRASTAISVGAFSLYALIEGAGIDTDIITGISCAGVLSMYAATSYNKRHPVR